LIALTTGLLIASLRHAGFSSAQKVLAALEAAPAADACDAARFVTAESPSLEKAAADHCCGVIAEEWNKCGVRMERIAQKHRGIFCASLMRRTKLTLQANYWFWAIIDTVLLHWNPRPDAFSRNRRQAYGPGTST